jgi:transcriptional regulator with XRE-family HTH domain
MRKKRSVNFQVQIGQRILFFRKKKKWSQKQLGAACNISHTMISKYERGEKNIGAQCLHDIMNALGVGAEKFFRSGLFATATRPPHLYKNKVQKK